MDFGDINALIEQQMKSGKFHVRTAKYQLSLSSSDGVWKECGINHGDPNGINGIVFATSNNFSSWGEVGYVAMLLTHDMPSYLRSSIKDLQTITKRMNGRDIQIPALATLFTQTLSDLQAKYGAVAEYAPFLEKLLDLKHRLGCEKKVTLAVRLAPKSPEQRLADCLTNIASFGAKYGNFSLLCPSLIARYAHYEGGGDDYDLGLHQYDGDMLAHCCNSVLGFCVLNQDGRPEAHSTLFFETEPEQATANEIILSSTFGDLCSVDIEKGNSDSLATVSKILVDILDLWKCYRGNNGIYARSPEARHAWGPMIAQGVFATDDLDRTASLIEKVCGLCKAKRESVKLYTS